MSATRYGHSFLDVLGKRLFPAADPVRRRTHLRFLLLAIMLGLLVCALLGSALWLLNKVRF